MSVEIPVAILVDKRNWEALKEPILAEMRASALTGVDIETNDARRHEGLNRLMKVDDDGFKGGTTKLIFDTNRTDVTGFSVYADGQDHAFYINLAHADVDNRIPWSEARQILEAIPSTACHVAHNAPYERTMLGKSLGHKLGSNVICTMQLAVSAFNGDTYDVEDLLRIPGVGGIAKLVPQINREFYSYAPGDQLTNEQSELLYKVIAKESKSEHSYNGLVKSIAYGFGLKGLTKKFLGYEQMTFDQVLNGKAHMGQLTGEEVAQYGADDAWVAVKLYHKLIDYLMARNPAVIPTFFQQENPMTEVFSEVWGTGVKIDIDRVKEMREFERAKVAGILRTMKAAVKEMLPFPFLVHEKLEKYDAKRNHEKYRDDITRWANMPDSEVDFTQCYQVRTAISKAWAADMGKPESKGMSITYFQVVRGILYDLLGCSFQLGGDGKIQSDKDAQDKMRSRFIKKAVEAQHIMFDPKDKEQRFPLRLHCSDDEWTRAKNTIIILDSFKALASADTTMKLFINKYLNLTDPDTGRIYPVLNSLLASRRMALAEPNLSQLPKFGGGAYVRSFFKADEDDHVVFTMDWSSVELVLIGDQSGDPVFALYFGQRPFGDMHSDTAASLLDMEVHVFKAQKNAKQLRTDVGKGANFNYWYSGALGTVADELGLSSETMWEFVEKFRDKFSVAEAWRVGVIQEARDTGLVTLPDGHQRIRFESTGMWANYMRLKAENYGPPFQRFMELCIKKIQTRSGNQAVNSRIQGTCATLAKRSILKMRNEVIPREKFRARFMFPVHDELVFSVHKSEVWRFKNALHETMCNHPDIVTRLMLDASAAIGLNYQAWHPTQNPRGQIELDELTKLPFIPEDRWGKKATQEEVELVVEYLFSSPDDPRFKVDESDSAAKAAMEDMLLKAKEEAMAAEAKAGSEVDD